MDTDKKPKRVMTPEQLDRLKLAREKALAVRQANASKKKELKDLEKQAATKELDDKLDAVKAKVSPLVVEEPVQTVAKKTPKPKKGKEMVIKEIIDEPDSDSSASDGESDDDNTAPVKVLYKNKYKEKYRNKYQAKTISQLTKGVAVQSIRKKVDDEIFRLASANMFGSM